MSHQGFIDVKVKMKIIKTHIIQINLQILTRQEKLRKICLAYIFLGDWKNIENWTNYGQKYHSLKGSVWLDIVVELRMQYCREIF